VGIVWLASAKTSVKLSFSAVRGSLDTLPALGVAAVVLLASGARPERGDPCPESDRLPSPDLYCIHLFPTDLAPEATGAVRLDPAPTPFGVSETADGTQRYRLTYTLDGLPAATYVAWATTPTFDTLIKLGPVTNGVTLAGEVALH
jgi:hypothetical protein